MRKLMFTAIMALLILMISSTSQALWHDPKLKVYSDKRIYEVGETVTLFAENTGKVVYNPPHDFDGSHIIIINSDGDSVYWSPKKTEGTTPLYPGEIKSWSWDQTFYTWVFEQNSYGLWEWVKAPNYGEQVPEGKYTAYHLEYGSATFWIGYPDYPGASDSNRQDCGQGDACLDWASNEHAKGREHAADP